MNQPTCGKCGLVMTRENSTIHPEYFLHDACLPDDMKPRTPSTAKNTGSTSFVVPAVWPSPQLEAEMRRDARYCEDGYGGVFAKDCACHVYALLDRVRELEKARLTSEKIEEAAKGLCRAFDVYDDDGGGIDIENPLEVKEVADVLADMIGLAAVTPALTREKIADAAASLFITDGGLEASEMALLDTSDATELCIRDRDEVTEILCHHLLGE